MASNWDLPDNICKVVGHEMKEFQCERCRYFDKENYGAHILQLYYSKQLAGAQQMAQQQYQQQYGSNLGSTFGGLFGSPFK